MFEALLRRDGYMPELNHQTIRHALDLVSSTYELDVQSWIRQGWTDVRIEVDDYLTQPLDVQNEKTEDQLAHAREILTKQGAVFQVAGTLRQVREVDTCKAVVMAYPLKAEGKIIIAVSFMGTSKRIFDWVSNLRMQQVNGMHQGFFQLMKQFRAQEQAISFPSVAECMGRESLTLSDIIHACCEPESPFMLFIVGHSQGAAIAQLYISNLLKEGVLFRHVSGYGFASPSVVSGEQPRTVFPMYHIINADDSVPHMGAKWHLGKLLVYHPDAAFRRASYQWDWSQAASGDRLLVRQITGRMWNTRQDILVSLAYLRILQEEPTEVLREGLKSMGNTWQWIPDNKAIDRPIQIGIEKIFQYASDAYESIVGESVRTDEIADIMKMIKDITESIGMIRYARAFAELCLEPHRAKSTEGMTESAYRLLSYNYSTQLHPCEDTAFGHWEDEYAITACGPDAAADPG